MEELGALERGQGKALFLVFPKYLHVFSCSGLTHFLLAQSCCTACLRNALFFQWRWASQIQLPFLGILYVTLKT